MAKVFKQSAVVPFRATEDGVEVALVTNRSGRRWVFPKGLVEPELGPIGSACNEAYEEAGLRGIPSRDEIGFYTYEKWAGRCRVRVFLMRVEEELADWPEAGWRRRGWFSVEELAHVLDDRVPQALVACLAATLATHVGTD